MNIRTLIFILPLFVTSASAQLLSNGYYRIKNADTKRFAYVYDDYGALNFSTTSADMGALQLWSGFDKASSDPATVCYIKCVDKAANKYDIQAQGTGIYEMLQAYLNIARRSEGKYRAYASHSGVTRYLGDGENATEEQQGVMSDGAYAKKDWNIIPLSLEEEEYFGILPTIAVGDEHYAPFYVSFPFSFAGTGMKAMYIYKIDKDIAVYKEITGIVPAETPVFVKCSSVVPSENKLNIGGTATSVKDNKLSGVYFNNPVKGKHNNQTPNDPKTMRLFGVTSAGELGFVKSAEEFIPANSCYLKVAEGTPEELRIVSEAEYQELLATGIISVSNTLNSTREQKVYTITGMYVKTIRSTEEINTLVPGFYLIGGRKVNVR